MASRKEFESSLAALHARIDRDFPAHLLAAQEFLQIPSVSSERMNLAPAADYLRRSLEGIGGKVELSGDSTAPLVYARIDEKREKTLLIYGMYDVQPVSGQDWSVPPFAATIREL